jgi:AraC-like DNA-binding protein
VTDPAPFEYVSVEPVGALRDAVAGVWFARGTIRGPRERIAPTGSTVLGIVLGDPIRQVPADGRGEPFLADRGFLIGPHDAPIVNEPLGLTWAVGVVATPIGCRAAFGVEPAAVRGRIVEPTWPAFGAVREALAAELGVSHGHLDREFARIVGLGPRVLARVVRLRRLIASIDVYGEVEWTRLAAELGWFDQAHLIRDFKRFAGVSPGEYAAAQRTHYSPEEAQPGFVPEAGA